MPPPFPWLCVPVGVGEIACVLDKRGPGGVPCDSLLRHVDSGDLTAALQLPAPPLILCHLMGQISKDTHKLQRGTAQIAEESELSPLLGPASRLFLGGHVFGDLLGFDIQRSI